MPSAIALAEALRLQSSIPRRPTLRAGRVCRRATPVAASWANQGENSVPRPIARPRTFGDSFRASDECCMVFLIGIHARKRWATTTSAIFSPSAWRIELRAFSSGRKLDPFLYRYVWRRARAKTGSRAKDEVV